MSVAQRSGWTWQSQRRERSNGPRALPSSRRFPIATTTAPSPGSPGAPPGRSRSRACGISQRLAPRPNSAMHTPLRNAPPRAQCVASATTFKPRSTKTNLDQRKRNDPSRGSSFVSAGFEVTATPQRRPSSKSSRVSSLRKVKIRRSRFVSVAGNFEDASRGFVWVVVTFEVAGETFVSVV
jgi:hypothetical protein